MRLSHGVSFFLTFVALAQVAPTPSLAQNAYPTFAPTPTQLSALGGRTYDRCLAQSGGNTGGMNNCTDIEYARLDRRLNTSYQAALRRLSPPKSRALRSSERLWLATRDEACLESLKDEREAGGTIYSVDLRTCRLEELKRRIVWIETRR